MVNPQEGLRILKNYNDCSAYHNLYHQKLLKKDIPTRPTFPLLPKHNHENEYAIMLLRKALFEHSITLRFESVSQRFYKEFGNTPSDNPLTIPDYLTHCNDTHLGSPNSGDR